MCWVALASGAWGEGAPAENPPVAALGPEALKRQARQASPREPLAEVEWSFHKSADGFWPSGIEQQYVWLMNRARSAPKIEGMWLAWIRDPQVRQALEYFSVKRELLREEFAALAPAPPAAFDIRLHQAALKHSQRLVVEDAQHHNGQFEAVLEAGFSFLNIAGSVFAYAENGLYGHAGFNVDWGGNDGSGMQTGRGHRAGLMSARPNVGVAVVLEDNPATGVGPQVTTINYATANTAQPDHFNRFIVGTVWRDANGNRLYDPGEGIGGVTVKPDHGTYFAVTGQAGGYAIPVEPGTYVLTFSGGGLAQPQTRTVTVGEVSVLVPWEDDHGRLIRPELSLDRQSLRVTAEWEGVLGQPSTVVYSEDGQTWRPVETGLEERAGRLFWSGPENQPGLLQRFWRIEAWPY